MIERERNPSQGAAEKTERKRSCETCLRQKEIEDTLNASFGEVDLTAQYCGNCKNENSLLGWVPRK
jgi:hypothetical protein